jgi:hypothetical protein
VFRVVGFVGFGFVGFGFVGFGFGLLALFDFSSGLCVCLCYNFQSYLSIFKIYLVK